MRKNPYNKILKEHLPLFMEGSITTTALVANEEQKAVVAKIRINKRKYDVNGVFFTMVQPPILNLNGTVNPKNILDVELGQTEVTQELFEIVMGWNNSKFKNTPQHPVERVSWFDCVDFCNKLSVIMGLQPFYKIQGVSKVSSGVDKDSIYFANVTSNEDLGGFRLPTVEEWEIFAKAGTQNQWAGTSDLSELEKYAWYHRNSAGKTNPVGKKLPNEWGLYDMTGSVWEWCWDGGFNTFRQTIEHVSKGGSCGPFTFYEDCRSRSRECDKPGKVNDYRGFRICRTIK